MKASIKTNLTLTILGSALFAGLLLSGVLSYMTHTNVLSLSDQYLAVLEENANKAFENNIIVTARQISTALTNPLHHSEKGQIERQISDAINRPDIESVHIFSRAGILLHKGESGGTGSPFNPAPNDSTINLIKKGKVFPEKTQHGVRATTGIFLDDQLLAILCIDSTPFNAIESLGESGVQLQKSSQDFILFFSVTAFSITLFLMVLAGFVSRVMADRITKPISTLQAQASRLGSGDLDIEDPIERSDEIGDLAKSIYTIAADLELQSRSVKYLAFHDPLTGIANRASFQMDLEDHIVRAAERKSTCAMMFIDIDDFKDVNDSRGHDLGDKTLKILADRISDGVHDFFEPGDHQPSIARIGGDEFTVILPGNKDQQTLREIAEKILELVAEPVPLENDMHQLSASIGIAKYPRDGLSATMLLNAADTAMYNSKSAGRGTYRFFEENMTQGYQSSLQIRSDFKQALECPDQLELLYQPIANISTGVIYGGEALMRWNHPVMGPLEPSQFINIVENNEIALAADLWVIESTLELLEGINLKQKPNFVISANISASNLGREQFPEAVARLLEQSPVNPRHLQLEITETYLHRDEQKALESIKSLRKLGVKFWLDDFCTGYSSLKHLHMFPANGIKIDRQFVISLSKSNENRLLVSAMISLANSLNIGVVAEGIDNQIDRGLLIELECELGQGDLFSSPLPRKRVCSTD